MGGEAQAWSAAPRQGSRVQDEANERVGPPAVAEALGGMKRLQPAERHQVFAGGLDTAQVQPKTSAIQEALHQPPLWQWCSR